MKIFLLFFFIAICLFSCNKKTEVPTQAEKTAIELKNVISTNNIHRVIPWDYNSQFANSFPKASGTIFSFSNGFIEVNGFFYNAYSLAKLKVYNIAKVNVRDDNGNIIGIDSALILYFE